VTEDADPLRVEVPGEGRARFDLPEPVELVEDEESALSSL